MEKITTKEKLIETIKNLLQVEILARDRYLSEENVFKDEKIVSTLDEIAKDEDNHIAILKELIKKLEG